MSGPAVLRHCNRSANTLSAQQLALRVMDQQGAASMLAMHQDKASDLLQHMLHWTWRICILVSWRETF